VLKQRHQLFVTLLAVSDAVVIASACAAAWTYRRDAVEGFLPDLSTPGGAREAVLQSLLFFAVPTGVASMHVFSLYHAWRDRRLTTEFRQIFNASIATIVSLIVLLWALGPGLVGVWDASPPARVAGLHLDAVRLQLAILAGALPIALAVERGVFRLALRTVRRRGWNLRHVAVVGTGRLGRIACRTLDRNAWTGIHVAYFVHHTDHGAQPGAVIGRPVLGNVTQINSILEHHPVDAVYIALPNARSSLIPDLLRRLERFPLDVRIIPDVPPRFSPLNTVVNELEGMPILSIRESPIGGLGGAAKRVIDAFGSVLGLIVFAVPMLLIALLIRLSGPGPVIFRQKRVSLGGEEFDILKFRTMHHVEDETAPPFGAAAWTTRDDPRITPLGRLLRRTSLDELPQLFNVLAGDMSLVGPRPERPELIARFREDWRGYMLRQHVKAGITGWAQVNGHRGDTSLRKRIQHDLFYIRHWSLGFDLKILWLTLFRGFVHRNAH